ncbi:MAG: L-2-hydroxyglutarate oxidase [Acidimicrobiia bacterium]|nr:L-2-hydroxyglutarate oxidase [Acidimicrobiia bacterium]
MTHDVIIIGGGIIGLATGRALLQQRPELDLAILEKESSVGQHQSGRNSGVLHSGLYYQPGSLKAGLCVRGAEMMVEFCREHNVPFTRDGKLVVAQAGAETGRLDELERRGNANGLNGLRRVGAAELREIEPHAAGTDALFVPSTGAVDFASVARTLAAELIKSGARISLRAGVDEASLEGGRWRIRHSSGAADSRVVVNCAGLYSDRIARLMGVTPPVRIVPFRGEYLTTRVEARHYVRSSIYPVPDPELPFLGVHLTRRTDGTVEAGPNAVLAMAREGYGWSTFQPWELWDALSYKGTWRLARSHWRSAVHEVSRSVVKRLFVRAVQRLVPELIGSDFVGRHTGVRAQALTPEGNLVDDFVVISDGQTVHVLNAPSPGATAALAIGESLADRVLALIPPRSR